ncbi:methyltransferase domain-containing protein [Nonomuraea longicatena]|uniref:Protein-L-isoaspartate O-methyltransferase n=1 Tax=Nonomuraea longicatena TaxID=83682 RepID=A0ABN1PWU6_9ACTN
MTDPIQDVEAHVERMIGQIPAAPHRTRRVYDAMRAVPRHRFVPPLGQAFLGADEIEWIIDRRARPDDWLAAVYSDSAIVTQVDDGNGEIVLGAGDPTSAASAPSTVADLLGWLDPEPGHRVLEVGTGTGWTAALLSHLVGAANVTSIEVDPSVAEGAAKNLAAAGVQPHLIVGDGAAGWPDHAPFDRVHVTCGVHTVPQEWIVQSRPGAVIVLPYSTGLGDGHGLRLTVLPDGRAQGRFVGFAAYMPIRSQRPADAAPDDGSGQDLTTRIDPRLIACAPSGATLAMAAQTGLQVTTRQQDGRLLLWVMDQADPGTWTLVGHEPGLTEFSVYQLGDRPLWDEICDAYFRWVSWGEPVRDRFGMTVTGEGRRIWLDAPERVISR